MNAQDLFLKLDYLSPSGVTLNVEQRASLQSSLPLLRKNLKLDLVNFWGKVFGVEKDYLIAQGFGKDLFAGKKNFVSHDGIDWVQLPEIDAATSALAEQVHARFSGDPSAESIIGIGSSTDDDAVAEEPKPAEDETPADEEEDGADGQEEASSSKRPTAVISEEKRLVHLIEAVDRDTSVVPRGAFMFTADNRVTPNASFAGLAASEAASLASYGHLRRAEALQRKSLLEREHLSKTLDFLDPLSDDIPRGAWSIRRDATSNVVTIRSLQWPGSYAYHVAGTPNFGYAYFGFGEKNSDIGFAL
eukprot:TRINITY_DN5261_c0_g1_i2.p1 TRINITY_DN5261_c0_g1~~TRINITY_DN5261_c0_g1_i2.p1  ORF type:complete len:303 (-),score=101.55 TRINITY_DN5261_c0_g1_i2:298-1206(-)